MNKPTIGAFIFILFCLSTPILLFPQNETQTFTGQPLWTSKYIDDNTWQGVTIPLENDQKLELDNDLAKFEEIDVLKNYTIKYSFDGLSENGKILQITENKKPEPPTQSYEEQIQSRLNTSDPNVQTYIYETEFINIVYQLWKENVTVQKGVLPNIETEFSFLLPLENFVDIDFEEANITTVYTDYQLTANQFKLWTKIKLLGFEQPVIFITTNQFPTLYTEGTKNETS